MSHVRALIEREPDTWLQTLIETYKISAVRDGDLVSLKYDQQESPMHEPIVQECRGMVVCTRRRKVLAWPYNKFWNHGEAGAAQIDWSTASILEKLDGSLMILHWDDGAWKVASSGHPTAGGSFGSDDRTFRDAFWSTWASLSMLLPRNHHKRMTFMFELCDQPNRVVVRYHKPRIVLHGARDLESGSEIPLEHLIMIANLYDWEAVNYYLLDTIEATLSAAESLDPLAQEGFVVVDANHNRVKIKSPRYVMLHHLKGEMSVRRAIELWQTGETSELLTHFPEFAAEVTPIHDKLDLIAGYAVQSFRENMPRPTRKEFALAVKDLPWSAVCFRLLGVESKDKSDGAMVDEARAIMRNLTTAALERLVES